ncbi:MAG: fasciclin domain-containing protein [Candidatus Pacebacteria bacterium]|nr:fasciclin domain-containing protein [Candidatus Paceibacterota bacterium]
MNQNKGIWVGVVSLIVLAALGLWWLAASRPLGLLSQFGSTTTNTAAATSTDGTVTTTTNGNVTVKKDMAKKNQDVATIVRGLSTGSTFNGYFRSTGVAATINPKSQSKYTVFVPTNGAFAQLPPGTVSGMTAAEKKRLIEYHVVSGRAVDVDQMTAGSIEALSRDALNFSYGPTKIPMVNSAIVITQYVGSNGVVIVIDNVLLPPKK